MLRDPVSKNGTFVYHFGDQATCAAGSVLHLWNSSQVVVKLETGMVCMRTNMSLKVWLSLCELLLYKHKGTVSSPGLTDANPRNLRTGSGEGSEQPQQLAI